MRKLDKLKAYFLGDGEGETNLNQWMKKKQAMVGAAVLLLLLIITAVLHHLSEKKVKRRVVVSDQKHTTVDGVLSTDFTEKNELSALEQQQQQMDRLKKQLATLRKQAQPNKMYKVQKRLALIHEINKILSERESSQHNKTIKQQTLRLTFKKNPKTLTPFSNQAQGMNAPVPLGTSMHPMESIAFHYESLAPEHVTGHQTFRVPVKGEKSTHNYVPAGTFAKVVLLEGADADASVNGQSDTTPILARILTSGTLPNGHHSHLRGCFLLASMYGDISSERGEARLTKISCTRKDGTILEKKVQGYLSFAGKEGIKGHPVMRNGKILAMAGISGLLSGFGSALQQSTQTQSISPLGATMTVHPSQMLEHGVFSGASTAMSQLAHYYIQRADQYHPIIEIGSGTVVTVIFQNGFSLKDHVNDSLVSHPVVDTPSHHNRQELKALLKEAQHLSTGDSTSPFSNVN